MSFAKCGSFRLGLDVLSYAEDMQSFIIHSNPHSLEDPFIRNITSGPFYYHGLTLNPAWISNHMPGKEWGEITNPFLNFYGCTVEV